MKSCVCLNSFLHFNGGWQIGEGEDESGGLETGELHDIGGGLLGGVEGGFYGSGDLEGAGDEFGAEEGGVVGGGFEVEGFDLADACGDRLDEVVGDFLAFDGLEPELEVGDVGGGEWGFEGCPPDFARVVGEAIEEPLELYADDVFSGADAGEGAIDVGFCY